VRRTSHETSISSPTPSFFDFDFGGPASNFTALESSHRPQQSDIDHPEGNLSQLPSISNDSDLSHFQFLSDPPLFDMNTLGGSEEESTTAKRRRITDSQSVKPEDTPASVTSMDDTARAAAEEDKRRRNTLASARFRQKKKMREQALEKDHKEMAARLEKMENRIKELELENKWLRGLVVQSKP